METLVSIVTWVMLVLSAAVVGFAVRSVLSKISLALTASTAAPALIGFGVGIVVASALLPGDAVPFLVGLLAALGSGLLTGYAIGRLLGENDSIGLGVAAIGTIGVVIAAVILGSPSKLVGFCAVILVGLFALLLLGARSLPAQIREYAPWVAFAVTFIGLFDWLQAKVGGAEFSRMRRILESPEMDRIASTLWAVVLAVGGSTLLFVAANLAFDRTDKKWRQFSTFGGAVIGFVLFGLLDGNRVIQHLGPRDRTATELHDLVNDGFWSLLLVSILIGSLVGYVAGYAVGVSKDDRSRLPYIGLGAGAVAGLVWGTLFADRIPVDTTVNVLWNAVTGAILCGALGFAIGRTDDGRERTAIGTAGGAAIGLLIGGMLFNRHQPRLETVPLILAPAILAAVGAGLNSIRGRSLITGAATGGLIGWLIGTFGFPNLGGGPELETMVATGVAGGLAGLRYGAKPVLDAVGRVNLEQKSRGVIFLVPALSFIATGLVIPLMRTLYLSLFDERSVEWVGLDNYQRIFTDDSSFAVSTWRDLFTSQLFRIGALLIIAALIVSMLRGRVGGNTLRGSRYIVPIFGAVFLFAAYREIRVATGDEGSLTFPTVVYLVVLLLGAAVLLMSATVAPVTGGSGSVGAMAAPQGMGGSPTFSLSHVSARATNLAGGQAGLFVVGGFLLAVAAFASLRGTLLNNLWWVFTVTFLSAGFGLAVAVLADRASYENLAKSLIFMPLAISFVGAGIIWRFMYIARDQSKDQTGVMNFIWVELGQISTGGTGRWIGIAIFLAALVGLAFLIRSALGLKANGVLASAIVVALPILWLLWRFTLGGGMGGTGFETESGIVQGTTVLFLQDSQPFNNLWLMLVLIWIQTGFAMVIFSAAIKAVPTEFIEAAKMDGATDSQIFWRITVPSIAPTIGVVVTTLIVVVMKVFDIVKVMTNGNFDTQVVANEMWQRAFTELNFGLGSALAVVLFLAVVPVMYYNIRTMQKEL